MLPIRLLIGACILSQACGIDKCPVEIRIEGDSFVVATTLNFNASQRIVPDLQRLGLHFVKAFISSNFHEQCMLCLFFGDKGGSYLHFDNSFFVFVGRKLEHSHRAFTGGVPGNGSLRKLPHDVHGGLSVCLVFRGRMELSLARVKFDDRVSPRIHRVKHNVARLSTSRECEAQHCRMLSRCDLHLDIGGCGIIRIEGHAVIIRLGDLIFMTENRASISDGITYRTVVCCGRIGREIVGSALPDPVAGYVRDLDALKPGFRSAVGIGRIVCTAVRRGHPIVEAERRCHNGHIQASGGSIARRVRTPQNIHIIGQIFDRRICLLKNLHIIEIDGDILARRGIIFFKTSQHFCDRFTNQLRICAQFRADLQPVVRRHYACFSLGRRRHYIAILINGFVIRKASAIAKFQVDRRIHTGVFKVVCIVRIICTQIVICPYIRKHQVGQSGIFTNRNIKAIIQNHIIFRSFCRCGSFHMQAGHTRPGA